MFRYTKQGLATLPDLQYRHLIAHVNKFRTGQFTCTDLDEVGVPRFIHTLTSQTELFFSLYNMLTVARKQRSKL